MTTFIDIPESMDGFLNKKVVYVSYDNDVTIVIKTVLDEFGELTVIEGDKGHLTVVMTDIVVPVPHLHDDRPQISE